MQIWKFERGERFARKAAAALKKGKVLVCPTDTVYGLVADATNKRAVRRIFQIKQKSPNKPLPMFVRNIDMAKKLAKVRPLQEHFLKKVWPGKVTVVLESKTPGLPADRRGTIGLRIPKYPFIQNLLKIFPRPVTGTSANIAGKEPARSIEEVVSQFEKRKHQPDIVIDEGKLPFSKPSKVIDLTSDKKKILRP
ncbi:MAG: L-threonylcarbamoyladenylate synthase [bacterium]|nr:L-threonylcarbamoyladenylate synthase [Candidatus Wildermuthbacteria bacterium]MDP2664505.1 L-threonylcarbamoyladenylate synthase [bacterium]